MKILNKERFVVSLLVLIPLTVIVVAFFIDPLKVFASHLRIDLATTDDFAILAGSAISDTGTSVITGDVGLSPTGGASITGLTCAEVTGTIYDTNAGYVGGGGGSTACLVTNASLLTTAKDDLTAAYNDAVSRTASPDIATNLGGQTLTDGTYHAASGTFSITAGQTLTLDGEGNADAVFIFKTETTFITGASSQVVLTNSAQACNVFWQVGSSATLGTSTTLEGNILALTSITDDGSSIINGRLLARNGAVTLKTSTVTKQTCAVPTPTPTPTPTTTPTPTSTPTPTPTPTPSPTPTTTSDASVSSSSSSSSSSSGGSSPCTSSGITSVPIILESKRISPTSIFVNWGPNAGLNNFIVQYGFQNGEWEFNTHVLGFSTTIKALPVNQPIWIQVAATDNCVVGNFSTSKFTGGSSGTNIPRLPNTGFGPNDQNIFWKFLAGGLSGLIIFYLTRRVDILLHGHENY